MKGWILFNGNIGFEPDFVARFAERITSSHHVDPGVRDSLKVLLVTAAWQTNEYDEGHLKTAFLAAGVPSRHEGGFEQNVQNLGLYHDFNRLRDLEPDLYARYHERQAVVIRTKEFYRRKNEAFLGLLRGQVALVRDAFPEATLARILSYDVVHHRGDLHRFDERRLLWHYCCQDLQDTMAKIVENDALMLEACRELDRYFRDRARIDENPTYLEIRDELRRRILSANSVFMAGGHMPVLINRLRFFDLDSVFREALWRGTNFYTISAGSMALCEKIIVYDDFYGEEGSVRRREFEFFDTGLGLVTAVTLFPHCMDRIQTDEPDNLTYLAHRFASGPCVGLNEESYLLVESVREADGSVRDRHVSVGEHDGVYVFDRSGAKVCRACGDEVDVERRAS